MGITSQTARPGPAPLPQTAPRPFRELRRRLPLRQIALWPLRKLIDRLDAWYEELPWRRRLPLGRRGEDVARRYLRRRGYLILARNYRALGAEIDLVALDGAQLVFIEVKTRTSHIAGTPAEAVDDDKQERLRRAADAYIVARHAQAVASRFDVVALTGVGRHRHLEVIKDAF